MAILERSKLFNSPKLDSRIESANAQNSERWLGYFVSPIDGEQASPVRAALAAIEYIEIVLQI